MKRFTDTQKWNDPWFMALSPTAKLLWMYLCDNCDNSGVVQPNEKLASFQIGQKITIEHFSELGDRIQEIRPGKILISKFISFQFGVMSDASRVHASVLKLVASHGLKYPFEKSTAPANGLLSLPEIKVTAVKVNGVTALDIYDAYPKKVARKHALVAINRAMKKMSAEKLLAITQAYAAAREGEDSQFTPYPASWFNAENYLDDPAMWKPSPPPGIGSKRAKNEVAGLIKNIESVIPASSEKDSPIDMSWMNKKPKYQNES